ncbi:SUMF1/EgtB/PvdO family nonheme iron enzyme [Pseudoalteromonas ulvae]|uniref:Sulfatase modifying factor 1 n=1 Tax=Pseudoalteromonas ulvae TaxID=107327 RepID=A0A244CPF6_PSEDV|nr:formylglycine-generating enzyme family protein [Pseudoalteromonas ulvae]OUL57484.1 sulfatase modifying factor 1 [Pseudoalteromonas ulvae]
MRLAPLSILISISLFALNAHAQDGNTVSSIESNISIKQTEFDNFTDVLEKHLKEESQLQQQLDLLRARSSKLDKEKNQALDAMNDMYRRMIEDPSIDIGEAKIRYQEAIGQHKQNKDDIALQLSAIASHRKEIEKIRVSKHALLNVLEGLKEQRNTARIERLRNEFTREGTVEVTHTVNCKRTETLATCEQRGQHLGLQKATKRFMDQIFANLSEIRTVEPKRNMAGAQAQVLSSHVVSSEFSGQGNYNVNLSVAMRGTVNNGRLCQLLNLDNRFCGEFGGASLANAYPQTVGQSYTVPVVSFNDMPAEVSQETYAQPQVSVIAKPEQSLRHELTLRSNVFDDEVFIDGVSYGSTKLQVELPQGLHDVEIRKVGYQAFRQTVNLRSTRTIRANLRKESSELTQIVAAPAVLNTASDTSSDMVVIPAGEFEMGDLTGNGLANELPVASKILSDSFVMHKKEVTVGQYQTFVAESNYTTEAETGKGCAYYLNGEPVWEPGLNWKSPGYEQSDDFPVVCLTYNDAKAFADWLTTKTGQQYRLPTEVEWEYAARAGSSSDYAWGNDIGSNLANCGWCGSAWSNQSAAPVGSFQPNEYGLYDMVGNVWEWTQKTAAQSDVAVRGGAWNFAPSLARSSTRLILSTDFRANYIGFRLVRER